MKRLNKKGITGIKDQDREILLNIQDDKELLTTCKLNKYFHNEVCNDMFFRNRLARTYSGTLKFKPENMSWKDYFLRVIYYIAKTKEDYKYEYSEYNEGNPKLQYEIFKISQPEGILLLEASEKGEISLVKYAINNGEDVHIYDGYALTLAAENGHLEIVKYLISQGVNVNVDYGEPLISASFKGHLDVVKYLVENGANIHIENHSALQKASFKGHLDIVKYLVENGANIHSGYEDETDYPLIDASSRGHLDVVKYLVSQGANIHANDDSALQKASFKGHLDVVKYLESL